MVSRYKLRIDGPSGKIETVINDPGQMRCGIALIAHPHPLHGGSLDNKVVQTIADALFDLGYVAVRPNFRGVGQSDGSYDQGRGEVEDMLAAANFVLPKYPGLPLILAGFSFGAYVQCEVSKTLSPEHLMLVGPAVNLFDFCAPAGRTSVFHGENDELVPLHAVSAWARSYGIEIRVVAGADHFFHRKLAELRRLITEAISNAAELVS